MAEDGVDQLTGGLGADLLDGEASFDFARYDLAGSGVAVRLDLGVGLVGEAAGDTYVGIEGVVGSEHTDILVGTRDGNYLFGVGGGDYLYGGGGFDELYGGSGADVFVFTDVHGAFATIRDFSPEEGDVVLFGGGLSPFNFDMYETGGDTVMQLFDGSGGVVVAHTTIAQLEWHIF
jgi:Ca2+-binding RTX toxin-like protein